MNVFHVIFGTMLSMVFVLLTPVTLPLWFLGWLSKQSILFIFNHERAVNQDIMRMKMEMEKLEEDYKKQSKGSEGK